MELANNNSSSMSYAEKRKAAESHIDISSDDVIVLDDECEYAEALKSTVGLYLSKRLSEKIDTTLRAGGFQFGELGVGVELKNPAKNPQSLIEKLTEKTQFANQRNCEEE